MQYKNYTESEFVEAVKNSTSIRQVLIVLGLAPKGGNYQTVHRQCKQLGLSMDHFTGQASNKNKKLGHKRPLSDYLSNKYPIQSYKLKKKVVIRRVV